MIGIFYDLYINTIINDIKIVLEDIFNILKKKEDLSKKEINVIFQKIAKNYYWGKNNNNHKYNSFIKYIDLLHLLIGGKDDLNQFNFFSYDLKRCDGIKTDLKEPKLLNEGNTLNFQLLFLTRNYHKNENINLIIIDLYQTKLELKLNGTHLKLFISGEERESMNFDINYDKWYKINFSFMNFKEDKIVTIGISELNKPKKEIIIKSTLINEILQFNKGKFFENFQGYFAPIGCYFFEHPRISFEGNIYKKNIFTLGENVYWKNSIDDEKSNKEIITNNNYKYKIYFIGGINFILPLFEKLLIKDEENKKENENKGEINNNENKKKIFIKLLNLIKEILIGKPYNVIDAYNTQFFELLGLFIQKLDNIYFENDIFHKFLFELSEDLIKQTKSEDKITNKKLNENDIESFYISLFFKYEIIIKVFNEDLNEYFDYINKNENNSLYKFMKFNVCGKFLNDYEKYKEKICPFIKMLIKHLIEIKNDNLNNLIYFVFKNYSNEELIYFILKTFIEQLINAKSFNSILNFDFILYKF